MYYIVGMYTDSIHLETRNKGDARKEIKALEDNGLFSFRIEEANNVKHLEAILDRRSRLKELKKLSEDIVSLAPYRKLEIIGDLLEILSEIASPEERKLIEEIRCNL